MTSSPAPPLIVSASSVPVRLSFPDVPLMVFATTITAPVMSAATSNTPRATKMAWLRSEALRPPAPSILRLPLKLGRDYPTRSRHASLPGERELAQAGAGGDPNEVPLVKELGDLDGVGGGPLAEVVAHHPEVETPLVGGIAADAAH